MNKLNLKLKKNKELFFMTPAVTLYVPDYNKLAEDMQCQSHIDYY